MWDGRHGVAVGGGHGAAVGGGNWVAMGLGGPGWQRDERDHCISGPSGTRQGDGVAGLTGWVREPWLEAPREAALCEGGCGIRQADDVAMEQERTLDPSGFVGLLPHVPTHPSVPTASGGHNPPSSPNFQPIRSRGAVTSPVTRQTPAQRVPFGTCPPAGQSPLLPGQRRHRCTSTVPPAPSRAGSGTTF